MEGHLDHDRRYDFATESWIESILRLWKEPRVDFNGEFFKLKDCVSEPKPVSRPRPDLICAGMSEIGLRYTAKYTDAGFVTGATEDEIAKVSKRAKEIAAEYERSIKTFAMYTIVPGATDAEAQKRVELYINGTDDEAVAGMRASYSRKPDGRETSLVARSGRDGFMTSYIAGTAETICPEDCQHHRNRRSRRHDADLPGLYRRPAPFRRAGSARRQAHRRHPARGGIAVAWYARGVVADLTRQPIWSSEWMRGSSPRITLRYARLTVIGRVAIQRFRAGHGRTRYAVKAE